MKRLGWTGLLAAITGVLVVAAMAWFAPGRLPLQLPHTTLQQLQELPVGSSVRLIGQVTYVDPAGKRIWIQDETGAAPIPFDPAFTHVRVGDSVRIHAITTARYNPAQGPASVGLQSVSIQRTSARLRPPAPGPADLDNFPSPEKNGLRVTMTAVVRNYGLDPEGRFGLTIAKSAHDVEAIVPPFKHDLQNLIDVRVTVTGIPEQTRNPQGAVVANRLWVASWNDIRIVGAAPPSVPLRDIRSLYQQSASLNDHRIRIRGIVKQVYSNSFLLADRWGAIRCVTNGAPQVTPGSGVEAEGFPSRDGLRIDLFSATATSVPSQEVPAGAGQESADAPLTTIVAVRQLRPARAAMALPVRVTGVATNVDPQWHQLYMQDATAGIYVKYSGDYPGLAAGKRITVSGLSGPGNFAPVIVAPLISILGTAPMPRPQDVTLEKAAAGMLDSQYVTIYGIVHPLRPGHPLITFDLATSVGQIHVYTSQLFASIEKFRYLEDAHVRIRGVFSTVFNSRRQLIGYQLLVEDPSHIEVLEPAAGDPFALQPTPVGSLLRYSGQSHFGHRVKVAGTVTLVGRDYAYLQDSTDGVEVRGDTTAIHVGDRVEAVGYPALVGRYSPVMSEGVFHRTGVSSAEPKPADPESMLDGRYDSMLVTVEGRLLMTLTDPNGTVLVLQSGVRTFSAELETGDPDAALAALAAGSIVRVTGVCSTQVDPTRLYRVVEEEPSSFRILLRSPRDITVTHAAPFWTLQTTLGLIAILCLAIAGILVWVAALRRRVRVQSIELQKAFETAQAIHDLSTAMQNVSTTQTFDSLVSVRGSSDIAQLVVGFNQMLVELEQRDRAKREAEARLEHMALVDDLTGLPNRRLLMDRLKHSIALARREDRKLAVVYIDLDGFKLVNDSLGHSVGDTLLKQVAERLQSRTRQADTLARLGGDEFTLILENIHSTAAAEKAASHLLQALASPFAVAGHSINIGASIGVAVSPDHGTESDQLLQQADVAMYAAKRRGKNLIVLFGAELGAAARERLILETELRRALADGEITVHYQPEFDLVSGHVIRFEALARWTHATLGPIPPLSFIPIAEESGLIIPLGAYIMERACREAVAWQEKAGRAIQVAVNVSSLQFAREAFVDEVRDILERTGLHPSLLQIELTESATVSGVERAATMMDRLKAMGVTIAMDDFGTGYSSLGYLPKLAFDALKIDRSFVSELTLRPESGAFIESILTMAHNLKMRVIVEGIETQDQLEIMRSLGADEAQGYLLGRPSAVPTAHLKGEPAILLAAEPVRV
ncbi:MAG TPA: EAL domain-containing protein [Acidobacteriaceae bacterium]|nr:EAL domain-containing protein [Acidobacteriaceae bacterium]